MERKEMTEKIIKLIGNCENALYPVELLLRSNKRMEYIDSLLENDITGERLHKFWTEGALSNELHFINAVELIKEKAFDMEIVMFNLNSSNCSPFIDRVIFENWIARHNDTPLYSEKSNIIDPSNPNWDTFKRITSNEFYWLVSFRYSTEELFKASFKNISVLSAEDELQQTISKEEPAIIIDSSTIKSYSKVYPKMNAYFC